MEWSRHYDWGASDMIIRHSFVAAVTAILILGTTLAGCNLEKDEFNPIRLFCPGDFDPATNKCKIDTPSP